MFRAAEAGNERSAGSSGTPAIESVESKLKRRRTRALTTNLPVHLQRGTRLSVALQGLGRHWRALATDIKGFELSEAVQELHTFISHDWGQSRWRKVVALHLHFFSVPALVVGTIVAGLLAMLQSRQLQVLPTCSEELQPQADGQIVAVGIGCCAFPAGSLAFAVVLLGGPSFIGCLRRCDPLVFLDKLCIHQTDDEMREQGILGLGGFLLHSRHLLVLCSPTYLSRMWCIYEIACWAAHGKQETAPAIFRPTALSWSLALSCSVVFAAFGVLKVMLALRPTRLAESMLGQLLILLIILAGLVLWLHHTRHLMCDVVRMREQLRAFRFEESQNFCCSNNHRHPETGLALPCDRVLVRRSIARWFATKQSPTQEGDAGPDEATALHEAKEEALEECVRNFDRYVQEILGPQLVQRGVAGGLGYVSVLSFMAGGLFFHIEVFAAYISWGVAPRLLVKFLASPLLHLPSGLKLGLTTSELFAKRFGRPENQLLDMLITAFHGFLMCAYAALIWFSTIVVQTPQSSWPQVGVMVVLVMVNLALFAPHCFPSGWACHSGPQRPQEVEQQEKQRQEGQPERGQQEGQPEMGQQEEPEKEVQQQEKVLQHGEGLLVLPEEQQQPQSEDSYHGVFSV